MPDESSNPHQNGIWKAAALLFAGLLVGGAVGFISPWKALSDLRAEHKEDIKEIRTALNSMATDIAEIRAIMEERARQP